MLRNKWKREDISKETGVIKKKRKYRTKKYNSLIKNALGRLTSRAMADQWNPSNPNNTENKKKTVSGTCVRTRKELIFVLSEPWKERSQTGTEKVLSEIRLETPQIR